MPTSAPSPSRRVSLRDVARSVGVSHVAVSLALRGDSRISETRRAAIRQAAESLGYRPDPMLTSLAAYRKTKQGATIRSTIAWLNQWHEPTALQRHREFAAFWTGASAAAARLGYRLEEFVIDADLAGARLQRILTVRNVRGILIPPHHAGLRLEDFDWAGFSVLRLGTSVPHPRTHVVSTDQMSCALTAFERVRDHGYRRIGFITSRRFDRDTSGNFRAGYLLGQDTHVAPRQHLPPLFLEEDSSPANARRLSAWLKASRPDAVISSNPLLRPLAAQLGVKVPRDLAVAVTSVLDGNFDAGVDQNCLEVGEVALRTLAGLIQQNERGLPTYGRRVLVEARWVDGASLPPRPSRSLRRTARGSTGRSSVGR